MTPTRRTWALVALALTLVLGACSTAPKNADAPTLEPQFGTADADVGIGVAASKGYTFLLSSETQSEYYTEYSYLSRYNSDGKLAWKIDIHEDYYDYADYPAQSVVADARGYAYVVASAEDYDGYNYVYVDVFDPSGEHIDRHYPNCWSEADLALDTSGNMYVACNGKVGKYSVEGTRLWERTVNVGQPIAVTVANGNVFVTGAKATSRLTGSNGNIVWTKSGEGFDIAPSGTNIYVRNYKTPTIRKLDANGKQLWSKTQSGLSGMVIGAMTADASGNVYLTGKYNASSSNRNIFTRKLNSSGKVLWTKTFGTSAYDDARGIATINGSEIYLTGATQGALAHPYKGGANDGYIAKLNSGGNPVWKR